MAKQGQTTNQGLEGLTAVRRAAWTLAVIAVRRWCRRVSASQNTTPQILASRPGRSRRRWAMFPTSLFITRGKTQVLRT